MRQNNLRMLTNPYLGPLAWLGSNTRARLVKGILIRTVSAALLWLACGSGGMAASRAQAQTSDDYYVATKRDFRSPEVFAFELHIGPYVPQVGSNAFKRSFPGDKGLMFGLELDYVALRIPDILYVGPGFGFSYAGYSGHTFYQGTAARTDESADFTIIPLSLLATVRADVLARKLGIPLIFGAKFGFRWNIWDSDKGGSDDKNGVTPCLTWAVQGDIDLDFFDPRAARLLDEEWGINHTYLYFELFGSKTIGSGMKLDDTTWTIGLGFIT
jgi:hypothetical protein